MAELWFDDAEALLQARQSPEWQASGEDEQNFIDASRVAYFISKEHEIIFIYIDRVIVSAWARRLGVAAELYHHVEQVAKEKGVAIGADVYAEPPNRASLKFHAKMGFEEIGSQFSALEQKTAAKLMKYPDRARSKEGNP